MEDEEAKKQEQGEEEQVAQAEAAQPENENQQEAPQPQQESPPKQDSFERSRESEKRDYSNEQQNHQEEQQQEQQEQQQEEENYQVQLSPNEEICDAKFIALGKLGSGESSTVWLVKNNPQYQHATTSSASSPSSKKTHQQDQQQSKKKTKEKEEYHAIKIFKCDPSIVDSYEYEKRINEFMASRLLDQAREKQREKEFREQQQKQKLQGKQQQQQQKEIRSPSTRSVAEVSHSLSTNLANLPFAAKDAFLRVQLAQVPKAHIKKSTEPSFMILHTANAVLSPKRNHQTRDKNNNGSSSSSSGRTRSVSSSAANSPPLSARHYYETKPSSISPRGGGSEINKEGGGAEHFDLGIATLLGHSTHHIQTSPSSAHHHHHHHHHHQQRGVNRQHPCLLFEGFGPSVEYMMSIFSYQGVALPVVVQMLRSACDALAKIASVHIVHSDFKPENLLLRERDYTRLEAVAKKSVAAAGLSFNLFSVVIIDFGLSFLLPLHRRYVEPPSHNQSSVSRSSSALRREQQQQQSSSSSSSSRPTSTSRRSSSRGRSESEQQQSVHSPLPKNHVSSLSAEELLLLRMSNYRRGVRIQTREYRAPEVILGAHFDDKLDVWSLGCTAYELVTGAFLFDPKADVDTSNIFDGGAGGEGDEIYERLLDLRHLWEIRRVAGEPDKKALSKASDLGTGVHAHRYLDLHRHELRLSCECVSDDDDDEEEGEEGEQKQQERKEKKKKKNANQKEGETKAVTFCPTCSRIFDEPEDGDRDIEEEVQFKFGTDKEGARLFANFVYSCVAWEPSKRKSAAELVHHPWIHYMSEQFKFVVSSSSSSSS